MFGDDPQQFLNERMAGHLQSNNAKHFAKNHQPELDSAHDYAVYEGVRQALMGGVMSKNELNTLIYNGTINEKQAFLIGDVHNFEPPEGVSYDDPRVKEIQTAGIMQGEMRREQLGV